MSVHRSPAPSLAAIDMSRPQFGLLGRATPLEFGVALDSRGVGEVPRHARGQRLPSKVATSENVDATNRNVAVTGSVPESTGPRAAKSVTGSLVDHSARLGSGSPSWKARCASMKRGRKSR
jgi:hypothetical protein